MSLQQTNIATALYLRLSNDDGNTGDSDSIVNQRSMLTKYAQDNGFRNIMEFVDDGHSGGNFQRPGFQRMLTMVENGEIGSIIVKDLSRLGREYIQMGLYTEIIFPRHNVNFIAINDSVDSRKGENNFAAFKNLFNEYFIRDTSRKIRAVKDMQQRNGKRVSGKLTPYGYKYDGEKLIIDEQVAPIVKRIFELCAGGAGPAEIARTLTYEEIPTPRQYKGYTSGRHIPYLGRWSEATIGTILESKEYIGHTITKKSYMLSYKQQKRIMNDEADTLIFHNTHEPLIDAETFEIVQNIRKNKKRMTKMGEQPIYSGIVFCADCGKAEYLYRNNSLNPDYYAYNCGNYRKGKVSCTPHYIRVVVLEKLLLEHIRMVTGYVAENERSFADMLMKRHSATHKSELVKKKRELDKAKRRTAEIDRLYSKLYEDRALGALPEECYLKMTTGFEQEQAGLSALIERLEQEVSQTAEAVSGIDKFLRIAKKHLDLQELDGAILRELVEKIVVHEKVAVDGKKHQQVDIHYNFVGVVDDALPQN
jgi:DNA invertase Pin-like site-specific DNA recombinase